MAINIRCPNPQCDGHYTVSEEHLGHKAVCKKCGRKFVLSGVEQTPAYSPQSPPSLSNQSHHQPPPPPPAAKSPSDVLPPGAETMQGVMETVAPKAIKKLGKFEIRGEPLGAVLLGRYIRPTIPSLTAKWP